MGPGFLPHLGLRREGIPGKVSDMLGHHNVLRYVSILVQVRLSGFKKIPQHCDNLTLELVGRRLSIKRHETFSSKKIIFLYLKTY